MSAIQFWKELVLTQTCTGSVSLVASSAIVGFITKKGLDNPYRRLIFGLSVADILQSAAIVAGPWLNKSDVPQALWGMGNIYTCRLDGFLFQVGGSAAPMYTLAISIYYMCKLKMKMPNDRFAHRVEKRMHGIIIMTNLVLYVTALGLDTIHSSSSGTICLVAAVPTGCRQNPELFGECDPKIEAASAVISIAFSIVIPIGCILGVILCFVVIFWHVLAREKIFGRSDNASTSNGGNSTATPPTPRRNRYLRSNIESSDLTTDLEINYEVGPQELEKTLKRKEQAADDSIQFPLEQSVHFASEDPVTDCERIEDKPPQSSCVQRSPDNKSTSYLTDTTGTNIPGDNRESSAHEAANTNMESLSRIYKKELLIQAISYAVVFCLQSMPYLIVNWFLVASNQVPPRYMFRIVFITFPLAGFFNIIVYTRPKVTSLQRAHPECSWLQAFWLVLKVGGEVPSANDLKETVFWSLRCCFCLERRKFGQMPIDEEEAAIVPNPVNTPRSRGENESVGSSRPPIKHANIRNQDIVSELYCGIPSRPVVSSSLPDSVAGMNGMSMSFESGNAAHRAMENWHHEEGGSRLVGIVESNGEDTVEDSEVMFSDMNLSDFPSNSSQPPEQEGMRDDDDDIWAAAFERAKHVRFSE